MDLVGCRRFENRRGSSADWLKLDTVQIETILTTLEKYGLATSLTGALHQLINMDDQRPGIRREDLVETIKRSMVLSYDVLIVELKYGSLDKVNII